MTPDAPPIATLSVLRLVTFLFADKMRLRSQVIENVTSADSTESSKVNE
jgi:hypothetical protein